MDCSCTAVHPDHDDVSGYSERWLNAAKAHICSECRGEIPKKTKYMYGSVFQDGTIYNFKTCATCYEVRQQFFSDGWTIGYMYDDLDNYFECSWLDDLPSSCISKLSGKARDIVCDLLQKNQL